MNEWRSDVFTPFCSSSSTPLCDSSLTSCSKRCMRADSSVKVISAKPVPSKYAASFTQGWVSTGLDLCLVRLFRQKERKHEQTGGYLHTYICLHLIWEKRERSGISKKDFMSIKCDTDLPQGFSSVVLSWKIFSKLYRLSTSSLSVSNSIQPLKFGRASGDGGWRKRVNIKELDTLRLLRYLWNVASVIQAQEQKRIKNLDCINWSKYNKQLFGMCWGQNSTTSWHTALTFFI